MSCRKVGGAAAAASVRLCGSGIGDGVASRRACRSVTLTGTTSSALTVMTVPTRTSRTLTTSPIPASTTFGGTMLMSGDIPALALVHASVSSHSAAVKRNTMAPASA